MIPTRHSSSGSRNASGARPVGRLVAAIFVAGCGLSLLLALRTQVGGDQLNLLARGWLLAARGVWVPYGNPASTGGAVPGGLTALLVGGPLELWPDHRAPVLLVLLTQAGAFLLIDAVLRTTVGRRERLLFALLYWLNPWRLLLSSFLWNPGMLLVIGALHLWSAARLRSVAGFGASLAHALALGLGVQLNLSVVLLWVLSLLLLAGGHLRLRWSGAVAGALLSALPLVPWLLTLGDQAARLPVGKGFVGRGLLYVYPLARGASYWLRHASLHLPAKETRFDFSAMLDPDLARLPAAAGDALVDGLGPVTMLLPLLANVWAIRRWRRQGWRRPLRPVTGARAWVMTYVWLSMVAALVVYSLTPITVMWWDGISLFHAAILALALWAGALARRSAGRVRAAAAAWCTAAVAIALLIAFGGPRHRCGGRSNIVIPLRHDHAMLHELGIHDSCRVPIRPDGWWPDVLPEPVR